MGTLPAGEHVSAYVAAAATTTSFTAYYILQPLADTLSLRLGIELVPLVMVGTLVLIAVLNPLYSWGASSANKGAFVATIFRIASAVLVVFVASFWWRPDSKWLAFCFSTFTGTLSLFAPTTLNAYLATLHTKDEARHAYGIIAAGSQLGQLTASGLASTLFGYFGTGIILASAGLYEAVVHFLRWRAARSSQAPSQRLPTDPSVSSSTSRKPQSTAAPPCNPFRGAILLTSTPFLRLLTAHTVLTTFVVAGIWYERADVVIAAFETEAARYKFFSTQNFMVGALTLVLQLACFSSLVNCLGFTMSLLMEPLAIVAGMCALMLRPGVLSIMLLDGTRRVVHYALLKPVKESLYVGMSSEVIYVAKPLLDTLVYRCSSVLGAGYFSLAAHLGIAPVYRQLFLLAVTIAWALNSIWLGHLQAAGSRPPPLV